MRCTEMMFGIWKSVVPHLLRWCVASAAAALSNRVDVTVVI